MSAVSSLVRTPTKVVEPVTSNDVFAPPSKVIHNDEQKSRVPRNELFAPPSKVIHNDEQKPRVPRNELFAPPSKDIDPSNDPCVRSYFGKKRLLDDQWKHKMQNLMPLKGIRPIADQYLKESTLAERAFKQRYGVKKI